MLLVDTNVVAFLLIRGDHTEAAQVLRARDRKMLAKAKTVWVPIDAATGRPKRVSDRVRKMFSVAG